MVQILIENSMIFYLSNQDFHNLLNLDCDINLLNNNNENALFIACKLGNVNLVKLLLGICCILVKEALQLS